MVRPPTDLRQPPFDKSGRSAKVLGRGGETGSEGLRPSTPGDLDPGPESPGGSRSPGRDLKRIAAPEADAPGTVDAPPDLHLLPTQALPLELLFQDPDLIPDLEVMNFQLH